MKPYCLERQQLLPVSLETAWRFFSDPANLARITPPDMDFRVTSPPRQDTYAGQIITYSLRPMLGIAVTWTTEITHVDRPHLFVDEQRFGPYRFWHHQHHFQAVAGGVAMTDVVHYLLPCSGIAGVVNRLLVAPRLKRIFDYRRDALVRLFPGHRG